LATKAPGTRRANSYFLKIESFYFFVDTTPIEPDACGVLIERDDMPPTEANDDCVIRLSTPKDGTNECHAIDELAKVLGIEPDLDECWLTDREAADVVNRWGLPWSIRSVATP
jgi:hypothetical protein